MFCDRSESKRILTTPDTGNPRYVLLRHFKNTLRTRRVGVQWTPGTFKHAAVWAGPEQLGNIPRSWLLGGGLPPRLPYLWALDQDHTTWSFARCRLSLMELVPSLEEFRAAIHHHEGSTAPGATGLTYNIVKGWPDSVTAGVHALLTVAFCGPPPIGCYGVVKSQT